MPFVAYIVQLMISDISLLLGNFSLNWPKFNFVWENINPKHSLKSIEDMMMKRRPDAKVKDFFPPFTSFYKQREVEVD
jgi:hypothetical protein